MIAKNPGMTSLALAGKKVSITGRLVSMKHEEASDLIAQLGGLHVPRVNEETDILVLGEERLGLGQDGKPTRALEKAREIARTKGRPRIVGESQFLGELHLEGGIQPVQSLYTITQLRRILGVSAERLRSWVRTGLLQPVKTVHHVAFFDFRQASSARTLAELTRAGHSTRELRENIAQVSRWLGDGDDVLRQLALLEEVDELIYRREDGTITDAAGQLWLDFTEDDVESEEMPRDRERARTLLSEGLLYEDEGDLPNAERSYKEALQYDPDLPEIHFNLGNVQYAIGSKEEAVMSYRQALDLDVDYVESWNNLGNVLGDLQRFDQAIRAFERALRISPDFPDVHYNLGETFLQMGDAGSARDHWRAYLALDKTSTWAERVRLRLWETRDIPKE